MILQQFDVLDALNEREADEIGVGGDEVEVAKILGGQRRQLDFGGREIEALVRLQPHAFFARRVNLELGAVVVDRGDPRRRLAVVDEHLRPDFELVDDLGER